jgi:hypothetical protein
MEQNEMQAQKKKDNQFNNLVAHYQTMNDYHQRQMEQYRRKSRKDSLNKSKE